MGRSRKQLAFGLQLLLGCQLVGHELSYMMECDRSGHVESDEAFSSQTFLLQIRRQDLNHLTFLIFNQNQGICIFQSK